MKSKLKRIINMIAIAIIVCITMTFGVAKAYALMFSPTTKCSLTVEISEENPYKSLLSASDLEVWLYRIASVNEEVKYTAIGEFSELDVSTITEKSDLTDISIKAAELAKDLEPEKRITLTAGTASVTESGLETGLYLVWPRDVETEEYTYSFTPMVIPLPCMDENTDWNNAVILSLIKAEIEPKRGPIEINKKLVGYNKLLGTATFVFAIEGSKTDPTGKVITYSNVVSIDFSDADAKSVLVDDIPVGMEVTITEVYSGASYRAVSDTGRTVTVTAENQVVEFVNDYSYERKYGTSVENHYTYQGDGHWSLPGQAVNREGNDE